MFSPYRSIRLHIHSNSRSSFPHFLLLCRIFIEEVEELKERNRKLINNCFRKCLDLKKLMHKKQREKNVLVEELSPLVYGSFSIYVREKNRFQVNSYFRYRGNGRSSCRIILWNVRRFIEE